MRVRKANAILATALVLGGGLFYYLLMEEENRGDLYNNPEAQKVELSNLETKLQSLEEDLELNANIVSELKGAVKEILGGNKQIKPKAGETWVNKTLGIVHRRDSAFAQSPPSRCDIEMDKVYDKLEFSNPDGGVWKQGWEIAVNKQNKQKLQVIVVPHSHNDPGWIKTFEKYYRDQTNKILTTMVNKMQEFPKMKFIWAEISYLSLWWAEQGPEMRSAMLRLLEEERLEIVTGGWVMPDEANSHYAALVEQLIHGHEWCNQNLGGYKPNSAWSIDPFGMSPTMAYILKRAGLDNMLIQRTHYSVKKKLAKDQNLEFNWRQHWDHNSTSDMFCHMMPFYSYDIPHTCGPDPKICCQFDFLRLPGSRANCPWKVPPRRITDGNVAERSATLLDQYRKKSELYKTNAVLIPLGDDFRWDGEREWDDQYHNYQKIMDYVNADPSLNAEIHWGTLTDYFKAVRSQSEAATGEETKLFPSLSGDFFTYADRDDHYWSGYFTSRPFWKNMDRLLAHHLRGAEVSFSLAWAEMEYIGADKIDVAKECMAKLVYARNTIGLFQHHDGVTGTAKDHVMLDYGEKMHLSIKALQYVIQQSTNFLLTKNKPQYTPRTDTPYFDVDEIKAESWSMPHREAVNIETGAPSRVVVFNTHARKRQEVVTFRITNSNIKVYFNNKIEDEEVEEDVPCQISPVFTSDGQISTQEYDLTFIATIPALGLETYLIREQPADEGENDELSVATIKIFNAKDQPYQVAPFSSLLVTAPQKVHLENAFIKATFSEEGLLESVTSVDGGAVTPVKLEFITYGTRPRGDKSGAYLFLPDGPGRPRKLVNPLVRIIKGKIMSYVEVEVGWNKHRATLVNSPGVDGTSIQLMNEIDLSSTSMDNVEISMRVSSGLQSGDTFYTDLNGFQMIRRKRYSKLPLQANWYPVPTMIYIQDNEKRVSLMSRQPLGGTSYADGQIEIMLDRRLAQDDNRGLFQGVQDNKVTRQEFTLLVENKIPSCSQEPNTQASYPSLLAHSVRHSLLHPVFRLIYQPVGYSGNSLSTNYSPLGKELDCDIHLVNLRTMSTGQTSPSDKTALIVHRQGFNACYKPMALTCQTTGGKVSLEAMFPSLYSSSVSQMSLSLMYEGMRMEKGFTVSIQPMEMYSFILSR